MEKFVDVLLKRLEPTIKELVDKQKPKFEELFKRKMDKTDEEMARLNLIYKLLFAIESYTLPTDKLVKINNIGSDKGYLTINVVVERDGQEYNLSTEVIGAGGYNIQDYHYRYLTNTKLPKKGGLEESKKIDKKIKSLSKIQDLEKEINIFKNYIAELKQEIPKNEKYSEEQIIDNIEKEKQKESEIKMCYGTPNWEEMVRREVDVEYYNLNDDLKSINRWKSIRRWKDSNILRKKVYLKDNEKTLKKLESKLEVLKGSEFEMGGITQSGTPDYLKMFLGK